MQPLSLESPPSPQILAESFESVTVHGTAASSPPQIDTKQPQCLRHAKSILNRTQTLPQSLKTQI